MHCWRYGLKVSDTIFWRLYVSDSAVQLDSEAVQHSARGRVGVANNNIDDVTWPCSARRQPESQLPTSAAALLHCRDVRVTTKHIMYTFIKLRDGTFVHGNGKDRDPMGVPWEYNQPWDGNGIKVCGKWE